MIGFLLTIKAKLIAAGVIIAAVLSAVVAIFYRGKAAERAKQNKRRLESIEEKRKLDDEINSIGPADVDKRFNRWMRDK